MAYRLRWLTDRTEVAVVGDSLEVRLLDPFERLRPRGLAAAL